MIDIKDNTSPNLDTPYDAQANKVLIIGAGCTGLALAHGLKRAGIPFEVYERQDRKTRPSRDWSFTLHWAVPTLKALIPENLFAKIQSAQADPHTPAKAVETLPFFKGETGKSMGGIVLKGIYRLNRSKTQALLMEGLKVNFGKAIVDISYSQDENNVTANFADGTKDTGAILVGTDGPHSSVRSLLLGPVNAKVTPIDFTAIMCLTRFTREQALFLRSEPHHSFFQFGLHPKGLSAWLALVDAPDLEHPEDWIFFHFVSFYEDRNLDPNPSTAECVALVKSLAKNFADPFKSAFEWMPDDTTSIWYNKMRQWDPSSPDHEWDNHNGRITLAGDAAHPMTYMRGQGLNHAIDDAGKLCEAIQACGLERAGFKIERRKLEIGKYEREMVTRTGEEVRLGEVNAKMLHDWDKVMESPLFKRGVEKAT